MNLAYAFQTERVVALVMDLCPGGDLSRFTDVSHGAFRRAAPHSCLTLVLRTMRVFLSASLCVPSSMHTKEAVCSQILEL